MAVRKLASSDLGGRRAPLTALVTGNGCPTLLADYLRPGGLARTPSGLSQVGRGPIFAMCSD